MQQYAPINITIVGNTTEELDSLLVAPTPIGANIEQNNTERITIDDYFSFWQNYDALVYSEEDYETAMLSATYASLHNLPLVIENTSLESSNIFSGKNVICVGNVSYTGLSCASQFSLEQLRHKYFDETNTNKLILIRPNDLNSSVNENFIPKKTANAVYEIYDKVSLGAAFLASAKKELIVSTKDNYFYDTDRTLKNWLRQFYNTTKVNIYLTIMAKPASISFRDILFNSYLGGSTTLSLDGNLYGDTNNDGVVDLYVGRIAGITSTDVFSYLARDLFYNSLYRPNNMSFLSSSFEYMKYLSGNISQDFRNGGYNSYTYWTSWPINAYFNKTLVSYMDHGGPEHSGLSYSNIPELSNTLNFEFSCASCYALGANSRSYCANIIRRGSIFYLGGVDTDYTGNQWIHVSIMNEIYYRNKTLGQAFRDACVDMKRNSYVTTMLADPTFYPNPQFKLKSPLEQSY